MKGRPQFIVAAYFFGETDIYCMVDRCPRFLRRAMAIARWISVASTVIEMHVALHTRNDR